MDDDDVPGSGSARQRMLDDVDRKSMGVTYLLWIFPGPVSAHRLHPGGIGSAFARIGLPMLLPMTAVIGVGAVMALIWSIWVIADAFLLPGMIRRHNLAMANRMILG